MPFRLLRYDSKPGRDNWSGFIDSGVSLEGTLNVEGTFRIEGRVKGRVISRHVLFLGERGEVEGQIEGNQVVIAGRFDGVILATGHVEIQTKGMVKGEIHSPCLIIAPGGVLDGRFHVVDRRKTTTLPIPVRAAAGH